MSSFPSLFQWKKWFTLLELIFALCLLGIVLVGAIAFVKSSSGSVNKLRQETVAINLAREGMESFYTRRNTNRLQHPSEKDSYWLCIDNDPTCTRFQWGGNSYSGYRLVYTWWSVNFVPINVAINNTNNTIKKTETLLLSGDFMIGVPKWWAYYRALLVQWLFQKDVNLTWWYRISTCNNRSSSYQKVDRNGASPTTTSCWDDTPKELRFCSKVEYEWAGAANGNVVLCGVVTNYAK